MIASQYRVYYMGAQSDDIVDETEGIFREMDGNVVNGRETTVA